MASIQKTVRVALGQSALPLGALTYGKDGGREYSTFAYEAAWLADATRFEVSPDLPLVSGHQFRNMAIATTLPEPLQKNDAVIRAVIIIGSQDRIAQFP